MEGDCSEWGDVINVVFDDANDVDDVDSDAKIDVDTVNPDVFDDVEIEVSRDVDCTVLTDERDNELDAVYMKVSFDIDDTELDKEDKKLLVDDVNSVVGIASNEVITVVDDVALDDVGAIWQLIP